MIIDFTNTSRNNVIKLLTYLYDNAYNFELNKNIITIKNYNELNKHEVNRLKEFVSTYNT